MANIVMKTCKLCNLFLPISAFYLQKAGKGGVYARCKECMKKIDRKSYSSKSKRIGNWRYTKLWAMKNRPKARAHGKIKYLISKGKILKQPCIYCGEEKALAHHCDYNKPLDIKWMCHKHHSAWHRIFISNEIT